MKRKSLFFNFLFLFIFLIVALIYPGKTTAQECFCDWISDGRNCQITDASQCPGGNATQTYCDDLAQECLCECNDPPPQQEQDCNSAQCIDGGLSGFYCDTPGCTPDLVTAGGVSVCQGCILGGPSSPTGPTGPTQPAVCHDWCQTDQDCVNKYGSGFTCGIACDPLTGAGDCVDSSGNPAYSSGGDKGTCDAADETTGIDTAIGCISVKSPASFVTHIMKLALGIAGGIAFLLMIIGAFLILTSSGNPEKIQSGKELITSAVTGLLLIIFAVFILRVIGVDILKISDFKL